MIKAWKVYRKVTGRNGEPKYADTTGLVYLDYRVARYNADELTRLCGDKHVVKCGYLNPPMITVDSLTVPE